MKRTLLDLTQSILSSLGSDEVNSISDTTESMQVAEIIRTTYFNMISRIDPTVQQQLIQLQPSLDSTSPVLMYVPAGIGKIEWLKYFNNHAVGSSGSSGFRHDLNLDVTSSGGAIATPPPGYEYVTILGVQQFLDITNGFNPTETNVHSFTFKDNNNNYNGNYTFYYKNNKQPQYCTILSDYYVIFDGYDAVTDDTLQANKSMAYGQIIPTFTMADSFIPNLDENTFPLLLNEAKSLAFFELKQSPHAKAEQEAHRGWSSVQKDKSVVNKPSYFDSLPDFGRQGWYGIGNWSKWRAK